MHPSRNLMCFLPTARNLLFKLMFTKILILIRFLSSMRDAKAQCKHNADNQIFQFSALTCPWHLNNVCSQYYKITTKQMPACCFIGCKLLVRTRNKGWSCCHSEFCLLPSSEYWHFAIQILAHGRCLNSNIFRNYKTCVILIKNLYQSCGPTTNC